MTTRAAAIALVMAVAAGAGCGEEPSAEPSPAPSAEHVAEDGPREPPILDLPSDGHPVVWVRRGRRAKIYEQPGENVIETVDDETEFGSPTVFAVTDVRGRWAAVPTAFIENGEPAWIELDPSRLRSGAVDTAIDVDLSEYRAELMRAGEVVRSFTVSIGAPGAETPTGRFAVTDTFRGDLNEEAYGCCAVALTARQTKLPSGWLGGDRIAIHGTSGPLGAAVSHGCVRAANEDVDALVDKVPLGTPVTIHQ